jgi:nucleoid-associated protein YgaU
MGKKPEFEAWERPTGAGVSRLPKILAEHTVKEGETLGALALKYYGSAAKEKWMPIYAANKAVIGPDPGRISPGQVLKIPELPE